MDYKNTHNLLKITNKKYLCREIFVREIFVILSKLCVFL